jgi:hypothetical protein
VQRYFSLCRLRLQLPDGIGLDPDEPPQVPFAGDITCHEPTDLPGAHASQQAKKEGARKHPVFDLEKCDHLIICQDLMGVDLWLFSDTEVIPRVGTEFSLLYAPINELQYVLPEPSLGLGCKDPVRLHLFGELYQFTETCLLSLPGLADIGESWPIRDKVFLPSC